MIAHTTTDAKLDGTSDGKSARAAKNPNNEKVETVNWNDLPVALRSKVGKKPAFVAGELMYKRFVAVDPLSNVAYFDAVNVSHLTKPVVAEAQRRRDSYEQDRHLSVNIHADLLRVKSLRAIGGLSPTQKSGGGLRGTISGFSNQSRMRLLQFMASVRLAEHIVFLTVTYPDEFPVGEIDIWLKHFEAFRRRFERRYPAYRVIWRKELQPRKSGKNKGKIAPHYHMLIFTDAPQDVEMTTEHIVNRGVTKEKSVSALSKMIEAWSLQIWAEIVDSGDEKHAQHGAFAVACRNRRHAYKYVSKYVAKAENDEFEVGRRWGRIGVFDTSSSFECVISESEFVDLLRLARSWLRSKGSDYGKNLQGTRHGRSVFGLGDGLENTEDPKNYLKTVFRMLCHAADLNNVLPPVEEKALNFTL